MIKTRSLSVKEPPPNIEPTKFKGRAISLIAEHPKIRKRAISVIHSVNARDVPPFHTTLPIRKESVIIKDDENSSTVPPERINFRNLIHQRLPVTKWLPTYTLTLFLQDLLAGVTVGLTEIPQCIVYAASAGLPSQYSIIGGTPYFFLGTCKDMNIGPTPIMILMLQPYVTSMGPDATVLMSFISGLLIFLAGILRLGFLVEFISFPVISGFTTAATISIACSQVNPILGLTGKSGNFLEVWKLVFTNIGESRKLDIILGLVSVTCLFTLRELKVYGSLQDKPQWSRRRNIIGKIVFYVTLSANALTVITGTTIAYVADSYYNATPFVLTGKLQSGIPSVGLPPFETTFKGTYFNFKDMISNYGVGVAFIPMIAFLEHIAIVKSFSKGKVVDATQEMLALGIGNIAGSLVNAMPVTGSFTRSAINNASGAKTTLSGVVTCLMLLISLALLTRVFQYIPKATLAAVIMVNMYYLCELKTFRVLWKTKKLDLIPFVVTVACCLLVNLELGVIIGMGTNMLFILYDSARPKLYIEKSIISDKIVYVVQPKVGLYFVSSEYLRKEILKCAEKNSLVIIDGEYIRSVDATVAKSFEDLMEDLKIRRQEIVFWNFNAAVIGICTGDNKKLNQHFKNDTLENITKDFCDSPIITSVLTVSNGK